MLRSCADAVIAPDAPNPSNPVPGLTRDLCGKAGQSDQVCRFLKHVL